MTSIKVYNSKSNLSAESQRSFLNRQQNILHKNIALPNENKSRNIWKWFVNFSSIGGFTQARDADNKISTLVWTVLFLVGFVLTVSGLVTMVLYFLEYNSTMNIELGHNSSGMVFPSVAVCNQNRVHCGHLYDKIISCSKVGIVLAYLMIYQLNSVQQNSTYHIHFFPKFTGPSLCFY